MSSTQRAKELRLLDRRQLTRLLIDSTLNATVRLEAEDRTAVFEEYARRALPQTALTNVRLNHSAASLNSVSAFATLGTGRTERQVFLKVHAEGVSGALQQNTVGSRREYQNARVLSESGWPCVMPLMQSANEQYPLLVYAAFNADTKILFNCLEEAYATRGTNELETLLPLLDSFHQTIGQAQLQTFTLRPVISARKAPVQMFFGERLKAGARADQWLYPGRPFYLPGMATPLPWSELAHKTWIINGIPYDVTLQDVIEQARKQLLYAQWDNDVYVVMAHGDDHPGNISVNPKNGLVQVFDPVAAGLAPAAIATAKALAHATVLPMAGMYYSPVCLDVRYKVRSNQIIVTYDFTSTPLFNIHEALARQIIDTRIAPIFRELSSKDADIGQELSTLQSALAMCALLTVDIALLLQQGDGRAQGLLPAAVLLSQLRGLPSLEYLSTLGQLC